MLLRLGGRNKVLSCASSVVKLTLHSARSIFDSGVPLSADQGKRHDSTEGQSGNAGLRNEG